MQGQHLVVGRESAPPQCERGAFLQSSIAVEKIARLEESVQGLVVHRLDEGVGEHRCVRNRAGHRRPGVEPHDIASERSHGLLRLGIGESKRRLVGIAEVDRLGGGVGQHHELVEGELNLGPAMVQVKMLEVFEALVGTGHDPTRGCRPAVARRIATRERAGQRRQRDRIVAAVGELQRVPVASRVGFQPVGVALSGLLGAGVHGAATLIGPPGVAPSEKAFILTLDDHRLDVVVAACILDPLEVVAMLEQKVDLRLRLTGRAGPAAGEDDACAARRFVQSGQTTRGRLSSGHRVAAQVRGHPSLRRPQPLRISSRSVAAQRLLRVFGRRCGSSPGRRLDRD